MRKGEKRPERRPKSAGRSIDGRRSSDQRDANRNDAPTTALVTTVQHAAGNRAAGVLARHLRHAQDSGTVSRRRTTSTPMMYRVDVRGQTVLLDEAQYRQGIADHAANITHTFLPRTRRRLNRAIGAYNERVDAYNDQRIVGWLLDNSDKWSKAGTAIDKARAALRTTELLAANARRHPNRLLLRLTLDGLREAEAQNQAAEKALQAYTKSIIGRGEFVVTGLEVTRDVSFAAAGAYLAVVAAPATAVAGVAQGALIAGGTVVIKTNAELVGRELVGDDIDYAKEYRAMAKEAVIAAATGAAGDAISNRVLGPVIQGLTSRAMAGLTSAGAETVERIIAESLTGSAKAILETAAEEVLKSYGDPKGMDPEKFIADLQKALVKGGLFTHIKFPPGG